MYYVYRLRSVENPSRKHIGLTSNLRRRIAEHNAGLSSHTSKYRPWRLAAYISLAEKATAINFGRYLKSGSGHAFARKRLW
jgi:predicted GIY-YIG superfamily endonuclease